MVRCPYCNSTDCVKAGHKNDQQVYQCNSCKRSFLLEARNRINYWTPDEEKQLRDAWASGCTKEEVLSAFPRHTATSITSKAHKLGLQFIILPSCKLEISDRNLIYLAGIIDGEGCIFLGHGRSEWFQPLIDISSTSQELVRWLENTIPVGTARVKRWQTLDRRTIYIWRLYGMVPIYQLIQQVYPYLIIKRHIAKLMLSFLKLRMSHPRERYSNEEQDLTNIINSLHHRGPIKCMVCVAGYFDPLHAGHLSYFRSARALGDRLVVVTHSDSAVRNKKSFILMPLEDRLFMLKSIDWVDDVIVAEDHGDNNGTVANTLKFLKPNIFAKGGDRSPDQHPIPQSEIDACAEIGCTIVYNVGEPKRPGWSSTEIGKKALGLE